MLVIGMRLVYGVGLTFASTSIGKAAADNTPPSRLMEGMGYIGLVSGLAMTAGNAAAVHYRETLGYQGLINVTTGMMVLVLIACLLFMRSKYVNLPKDEIVIESGGVRKEISMWKEKKAMPYVVVHAMIMIAGSASMTFLVAYCDEIGIGDMGMYYVVSTISSVIIRLVFGKLADRKGANIVIIPSFILMIINFACLPFISNITHLYLLGVLGGAAGGMLTPILQGMMVRNCPGRTGNASALYYAATDAGLGIGGILFGLVATGGYRICFVVAAGIYVCALVVYLVSTSKSGVSSPDPKVPV
jgi:predicted MFS family arabinose efflux permease